jgi:hypothetical protein
VGERAGAAAAGGGRYPVYRVQVTASMPITAAAHLLLRRRSKPSTASANNPFPLWRSKPSTAYDYAYSMHGLPRTPYADIRATANGFPHTFPYLGYFHNPISAGPRTYTRCFISICAGPVVGPLLSPWLSPHSIRSAAPAQVRRPVVCPWLSPCVSCPYPSPRPRPAAYRRR